MSSRLESECILASLGKQTKKKRRGNGAHAQLFGGSSAAATATASSGATAGSAAAGKQRKGKRQERRRRVAFAARKLQKQKTETQRLPSEAVGLKRNGLARRASYPIIRLIP